MDEDRELHDRLDAAWERLVADPKRIRLNKAMIAKLGFDPDAERVVCLFRYAFGVGVQCGRPKEETP